MPEIGDPTGVVYIPGQTKWSYTPAVEEADILEKAADILEVDGWCQGAYDIEGNGFDQVDRHCAVGAIIAASKKLGYGLRSELAVRAALITLVKNHPGRNIVSVEAWNDRSGRTAHQVIDLLKETAKDIRNDLAA